MWCHPFFLFSAVHRYPSHVMHFLNTSAEFGFLDTRVTAKPLRASVALYQASSVLRALRYLRDLSQSPANAPKRSAAKRSRGHRTTTSTSSTKQRLILPLSVSLSLPEIDVRIFSSCKSASGLPTDNFFMYRMRKLAISADVNERSKPTRVSLSIESMDLLRLRPDSNNVQHPSHHLLRSRSIVAHRCNVFHPQTNDSLVYFHIATSPIDVCFNALLISELLRIVAAAPMLPPSTLRHRRLGGTDEKVVRKFL